MEVLSNIYLFRFYQKPKRKIDRESFYFTGIKDQSIFSLFVLAFATPDKLGRLNEMFATKLFFIIY